MRIHSLVFNNITHLFLNMSSRRCLIIFAISLASCSASVSSNEPDKRALLALRDEFIKGGTLTDGNFLNSWNDSQHFCQWKGITCGKRHKRVTVLNLAKQELAGLLSPSIGNLTFLIELYLTNNSLHGEIPKQIGQLSRLQIIDLGSNSFQGQIPSEIGNCSNLSGIGLSDNKLTGTIPFEFGSLSKITLFYVTQNHLTGEMPTCFRNFSSLSELTLENNNFYGEIQDSLNGLSLTYLSLLLNNFSGSIHPLYNISSLQSLTLGSNHFSGTLPRDIDAAFPNLYFFSLSDNNFTGTIPPSITNISGLSVIQLSSNKFTGSVPEYNLGKLKSLRIFQLGDNQLGSDSSNNDLKFMDSLTNCTELEWLIVGLNRLHGTLQDTIANFTSSLELLEMSLNYIRGGIPEGIGELSGLSVLDLAGNQLSSTIPVSLGKLSNLSVLYLRENNLHGELPSSLGNLTYLSELYLSRNALDGTIPTSLGKCKDVRVIDIAKNQFTGNLPDDVFSQFPNLRSCDVSGNLFNGGAFTSVFGKLKALNYLDVSHNFFTGQIPFQLGESLGLESLNMAANSFDGSIPSSLGNLRALRLLDLSSNNLSGQIPKELASLALVQNLNLSYNQLEGEVPMLINFTGFSVEGNSKLCGGNPELQLQPCFRPREEGKRISRKFIIVISLSVTALFSLIVFLGIFFGCRRKHAKGNAGDDLSEEYPRVTYAELFKATEGFSQSNLIGTGSFGDVYRGILEAYESKAVAVKVLKLSMHGATKSFNAECKILRSIRHRNLLRIITSCSSLDHKGDDFKALVFDLMSNGNLDSWLHFSEREQREARIPLTLAKRLEIAIDVGCALDYLHNGCETSIVHCDLKPSNILLDQDMVAHVGDFGLAMLLLGVTENPSGSESLSSVIKGSIGYIAPEYGMGATISTQGDTYSYGILLLELITAKRPTDDMFKSEMSLRSFLERATPDHVQDVVDPHLVNELREAIPTQKNPELFELQWHNFLVSFAEVATACSAQSSTDRMDIQSAVRKLNKIKEKCGMVCQI